MFDLKSKRVLFIAYHYPPEDGPGLPGVLRTVKFIRNLKNGHFSVLSVKLDSYPIDAVSNSDIPLPVNHESIYRAGCYDVFTALLKCRTYLKKLTGKHVQNNDIPTPVFKSSAADAEDKRSFFQKIKDFVYDICYFPDQAGPWIFPAFTRGLNIIRKNKVEVIFATGMPWSGLIAGWLLHLVTRKPLIADFRDPWIGNPFHKSKGGLIDSLSSFFERRVVNGASLVTANTEMLREDFLQRYPNLPDSHFMTLPNGFDPSDFSDLVPFQGQHNAESFVLCHAGYLYGLRDPAPILDAIRICNQARTAGAPLVVFKQIGRFDLHYDLKERYADLLEQGSLQFLPECPYGKCLEHLAAADILVNVQSGTKTQIPSKLYDYLALNKPILNLTPLDGALGQMVSRYGFGGLFEETDVDSIAEYLNVMQQRKKEGTLAANYVERNRFDIGVITAELGHKILQLS